MTEKCPVRMGLYLGTFTSLYLLSYIGCHNIFIIFCVIVNDIKEQDLFVDHIVLVLEFLKKEVCKIEKNNG